MLLDTPGPAPAATTTTTSIKRFKIRPKPNVLITKPVGMTICSLPMEIQEEILSHLLWYEHFAASMVCPEWATLLQLPRFRQKRYCIETWTESESEEDSETIAQEMGFHRYHPDETVPKDLDDRTAELGMHGLLGTGTMVLSVRETGDARVYLAIRRVKESWKGKNRGEYVGPMMGPYEEMFPFDVGLRRCRWKRDKQKVEISFHEITGSPLLATDTQFYYGIETNEEVPKHVQARIKKDCKSKYWANDSDTWKEIREREDDISVRILDKDFLTDGIRSRVRHRCDVEYADETTVPGVLPISSASIDTGTTVQEVLECIKEALTEEQELDGLDGPLECWATFQEFWPQRKGESGPEDVNFHPRRKIFLSLWNLSRWSLDKKKGYVDCTCDGDARHCACQWLTDIDDEPWFKSEMRYKARVFDYDASDDDEDY
ncbi:uncharacterized protein DFL_006446 [Arthrobotrys flagrans]|uniref:F-box domain-containing protein n=1 Tax=Arthrobotrys flagrans TaxID=97331 RepID=A0A437A0F9_ARTFL|nr:hypothetical protein DFL_006446 [Arthrobotrys flagrans]